MPYYYYWDWTYLLIIPGLILGLIAQAKVKSAYAQCSRIPAKCGLTASQMVADLLRRNGNTRVRVGHVSGELTDHYDPSKEVLNLSDGVYSSNSIAAMGIAAHEAGHAMQKLENYAPLNLRSAIVPAVNICHADVHSRLDFRVAAAGVHRHRLVCSIDCVRAGDAAGGV